MSYLKTLLLVFALSASVGCVSSGAVEPEKWAPEKRADAHVNLGMTYLRENQFDTAAYEFDAAIATNPKSDKAYHAKGLLFSRIGDTLQATAFFKKAVELNPENYLAVNDYAIHLCQQGNSKRGIQQLLRIESIAANDKLLGTQLGLGVCYAESGKVVKADQYLRAVLKQEPYVPQALLPMAEVSFSQKEYLSSRAFLERYFGTGAISEKSLFLAAKVEHTMGDLNKANQYRRELQRRYPGSLFNSKLKVLLE
jgi:type IV pilus assembly protein PilF